MTQTMTIGRITTGGRTTVPKDIRDRLKLKPGDKVYWIYRDGQAVLRPKNRSITELAGLLYDPARKPMSIDELNHVIGQSVSSRSVPGLPRAK
jgi:AbrB family looped-hinge helix DNA binding protein